MSRKSYPNVNAANQYARDVVRGKIVACQFVIQACQRHLDDLMEEKSKSFRYRFDKDLADPKYRDAYSTHIPAVILAVNNNPMRFTDRSGGVSRRRVIIHFPEQIAPQERDPQLKDKITRELAVIVRHLMQKFSDPMLARSLLQSQQNSDEALNIKRDADPTFDFIGYLETLPQTSGMYMGNASIIPRNYRKYLYHAYLAYMEANGYRNVLSLKMFGLGLPVMLKEYGLNYEKRHTKQGIQTNLTLKEESYGDWLPKCDDPATT